MAYDYSSQNDRLELPNPYRVENVFLFVCAAATLVGGIAALVWARAAIAAATGRLAFAPLVVGVGLLVAAVAFATVAARRLRFFFGRKLPHSLAPEVALGATGNSGLADHYKSMLRQGGLEYTEPKGALNGLLYNAMPRLITAPAFVQVQTQRQFFNLLAFVATALSFVFAWAALGTASARPLVSIAYFLFAGAVLLKPMVAGRQARLGTGPLVGLVVAAIVGPVAVGLLGSSLPSVRFSLHGQTFTLLLCALLAVALLLAALHAQVDPSPQTERSCEQRTISMNGPPGALLTELDRRLQAAWSAGIPNRRYTRLEPVTEGASGSGRFAGELMEETQPLPMSSAAPVTFENALSSPRHVWLVVVDLYATLMTLLGVACALMYAREFDPARILGGWGGFGTVGYALVFLSIAAFCFQSAGAIWGRFNFESRLLWVEMLGTWQSSRIGTGNQLSSQLQTSNDIVRVEAMTLRVWQARIESVTFGKDGERQVTATYGCSEDTARLASELEAFAGAQSAFVVPRAPDDRHRIESLRATDAALSQGDGKAATALAGAGAAHEALRVEGAHARAGGVRFCSACGTQATAGARFCSACGTAL